MTIEEISAQIEALSRKIDQLIAGSPMPEGKTAWQIRQQAHDDLQAARAKKAGRGK